MTTEERWLPVVGFDGYEVSDLGRLRSYRLNSGQFGNTPKLISAKPNHEGYPSASLTRRDGRRSPRLVHRLVLEAFVGPCPQGYVCRHFPDDTKSNCALSNLQWGTLAQNWADMLVHGTAPVGHRHGSVTKPGSVPRGPRSAADRERHRMARGERNGMNTHPERRPKSPGEKHGMHKLKEVEVVAILKALANGETSSSLARRYKVSPAAVYMVKAGKSWKHVDRCGLEAAR